MATAGRFAKPSTRCSANVGSGFNVACVSMGMSLLVSACAPWTTQTAPLELRSPGATPADKAFTAAVADFPSDTWWVSFGDTQLDDLIAEAMRNSPTIAQAGARIRSAQAQLGTSRAALVPSITAAGAALPGKIPESLIGSRTEWRTLGVIGLDFIWEIDFWGKNRGAVKAASSEEEAARADAASAELILCTAIGSAYVDLYGLYAQRDLAEAGVRVRRETRDLVERRVGQGLDNVAALRQAASRFQSAVADLAAVDESIALNRIELAALLGAGPDRGIALTRPMLVGQQEWGLPPDLPAQLIGRKPEIVAARWRAEAAARRIGVAKASFYPNVNLLGLAGVIAPDIGGLLHSQSSGASVGPAITLPLFDGRKLNANYGGARANYDNAVASYNDAIVQALRETADAVASLSALGARRAATDESLAEQEQAYSLAQMRYRAGLADYQSVLIAENALLTARNASTILRVRGYTLNVALIRALGGGFRTQALPTARLTL
jgi:NodT family efflux transporter outer membrane factor (OMF) lipoprotein